LLYNSSHLAHIAATWYKGFTFKLRVIEIFIEISIEISTSSLLELRISERKVFTSFILNALKILFDRWIMLLK